jgi:hypothetical protein
VKTVRLSDELAGRCELIAAEYGLDVEDVVALAVLEHLEAYDHREAARIAWQTRVDLEDAEA